MALPTGTLLGPYEILSLLGEGGMGEVYRARDRRLGRDVAVKLLAERAGTNPDLRSRFEREARAVAAIDHPNVLAIHDVGEAQGRLFLVTELLAGASLREAIPPGGAGWKRAAAIGAEVADGLAAAHARGIVHRDVKPENVVLGPDGRVKVLDFGIARSEPDPSEIGTRAETAAAATEPGTVLGTVGYMAPEQLRGLPCDGRADVFALGCVLYELATGERAFLGPTPADTMSRVLHFDPMEGFSSAGPDAFRRIVARCLEKDRARRFQSMSDLAFALRLVGEPDDEAREFRRADRSSPAKGAGPPSVAVLPFANRSPDTENEYLCDGMTEELIGGLSRVPGLRVASRTSVFALKGRFQDVRSIGRELGATAILEGSLRRSGDHLRITAQLTSVADGYHLWSDNFDGDVRDVFAFQDEIARKITAALGARLGTSAATPLPRKKETASVHAYQLYWKGRHLWGKRTPEQRLKAIALFEEAITSDPGYARAYAGLADCFLERGGLPLPARVIMDRARAAAMKALELDEGLADAHTSLGRVLLYFDWDGRGAEREFRRAIELDSAYAEGHHSYSHFLLPAGRTEESLAESRRALELEPLDLGINTHLGWHFLYSGDFDAAVAQCRFSADMDPAYFYARFYLGMALEQRGEIEAALAEFQEAVRLSPESAEAEAGRIHALGRSGRVPEAREAIARLEPRAGSSIAYEVAVALVGIGERELALAHLEDARRDRSERIVDIAIDPRLRPLHGEPEFRRIAAAMGFAA
ncbi:MAG TPA: protein kinase [Thermoanaerobaculia bacterium]|nr:protein kinase [Thermoanaerobaculia bacterium]